MDCEDRLVCGEARVHLGLFDEASTDAIDVVVCSRIAEVKLGGDELANHPLVSYVLAYLVRSDSDNCAYGETVERWL
jgi:hypothetical protein